MCARARALLHSRFGLEHKEKHHGDIRIRMIRRTRDTLPIAMANSYICWRTKGVRKAAARGQKQGKAGSRKNNTQRIRFLVPTFETARILSAQRERHAGKTAGDVAEERDDS